MNSLQLKCAINSVPCLKQQVKGVFSRDNLPGKVLQFPSAYICNTDYSTGPGIHWIAIRFNSPETCEFFDSFGQFPSKYGPEFCDFIDKNSKICVFNNVKLQGTNSDTCGYHVLYYLIMKCLNINFKMLVNGLYNHKDADNFVYQYITNVLNRYK